MTRQRVDELSPAAQKRMLTAALLRAAASAALLVVVYYLAPLNRPLDAGTWIEFALGLVVFAVIIGYHTRAIAASDVPHLRLIQAVATGAHGARQERQLHAGATCRTCSPPRPDTPA